MNNSEKKIDTKLKELLDELQKVPAREAGKAELGKAQFLHQAASIRAGLASNPLRRAIQSARSLLSPTRARFSLRQASIAVIIAAVVLLGGGSITAYAAQKSLPGDSLYTIKLSIEDAFIAFSLSDSHDLELHLEYASRRFEEITTLLGSGRSQEIESTASRLAYHLESAEENLSALEAANLEIGDDKVQQMARLLSAFDALFGTLDEDDEKEEGENNSEEEIEDTPISDDDDNEGDSQPSDDEEHSEEPDEGEDSSEGDDGESGSEEGTDEEEGEDHSGEGNEHDAGEEDGCDQPDEHGGGDDEEDEQDEEDSSDHDEEDTC